jgi:hypothetical protein
LGSNNTRCVSGVAEVSVQILNSLLRCFLWVVFKLGDSWDSQVELAGSVVGGGSASLEPIDNGGLQRREQRFVLFVIDIMELIAVSVAAIILTSCNQDSGISDQQISDYIKTQIPFFISQALYATASQSSSHECQADRRARK